MKAALTQALEALEVAQPELIQGLRHHQQVGSAIAACRAALAQPDDAPKDDKTGRPPPALMQDDHKGLSQALSRDPNARQLVRDAAAQIADDAQDARRA